ncbi:MAG TPA: DUF4965 domain-containing protein [Fimbriimonas sp.]
MNRIAGSHRLLHAAALLSVAWSTSLAQYPRPPAVPLVAHDPYFSVWSTNDRAYEGATRHWTGAEHSLTGMVRIDGRTFRLMGKEPETVDPLPQTSVQVLPTRTIYTFEGQGAKVTMTFTTPTLPHNLEAFSRPATYVTYEAQSTDRREKDVSFYFDAGSELCVNSTDQRVRWSRESVGGLNVLKMGSEDQRILGRSGDNLRIDWGHLYLAADRGASQAAIGSRRWLAGLYSASGRLSATDDRRMPREVRDEMPVSAVVLNAGRVGSRPVARYAILAYDDLYSITYFRTNLRPYWRRNGAGAHDMLRAAARDYAKLQGQCRQFDQELTADMARLGGTKYAYLGSLAFRQSFAAQKVAADAKGQPLMFSKENFSNGCIATVDVLYPAAPGLLLFSPTLTKASLVPILDYAASSRWKFPFAPHDLGTYPLANGQVYGGGERTEENQMPVEESGNMLILLAALAKNEGNADFAVRYWPTIKRWAEYLAEKGFDPESQLSTDDFAGHLAHNVNLSAKAIEALGSYAYLCDIRGLESEARRYRQLAQSFADRWLQEAADGDHYRLAFDKPGTWSQKYNLVWDRLLGLNLFPASAARKEMDFYLRQQNRYGLPLDNRRDYTKLDWIVWSATLTRDRRDFEALIAPVYDFFNDTPDRAPMADWFRTVEPRKEGFQARSVVGGVFIKLLDDPVVWRRYSGRDPNLAKDWAPIPPPIVVDEVVPTSRNHPVEWSYRFDRPGPGWQGTDDGAAGWQRGAGGFGTQGTPGSSIGTVWNTSEIWLRREFDLPEGKLDRLQLFVHHDEDAEIYLNGVLAASLPSYVSAYETYPISPEAKATLKPGRNVLAIHCRQTGGGQFIDAGLAVVRQGPKAR